MKIPKHAKDIPEGWRAIFWDDEEDCAAFHDLDNEGNVLRSGLLEHVGWAVDPEAGHRRNIHDYFAESDNQFMGPDEDGTEPLFDVIPPEEVYNNTTHPIIQRAIAVSRKSNKTERVYLSNSLEAFEVVNDLCEDFPEHDVGARFMVQEAQAGLHVWTEKESNGEGFSLFLTSLI
jgi:hypothetical protein